MAELKKLGRYELRRVLGKGAMGVVYEGFDPMLSRRVAVKTILRSAALDEDTARSYSERFVREAKAVGRLNHPNIVQVHDFGEENDVAYLVMEFIDGRDLRAFLDARERFERAEAVRVMGELLDALDFAHERGVIHRDIKPANLMLDLQRRVKLTDFGVARLQDSVEQSQAGTMVGTPAFMSPEQIRGGKIDGRTDIFSAGTILYQLLTGEHPFKGEGAWTVAKKIVEEDPPPPSSLLDSISPAFDTVVRTALAKLPAQRFGKAREFAEALRGALAGSSPAPDPSREKSATKSEPSASNTELEYWRSIQQSNDPEEFELYLTEFPTGAYGQLARLKIAKLREPIEAARKVAEEKAWREVEENAKREAKETARREAEEAAARKAAQERARQEAEERIRREAEEKTKREAEAGARREVGEKARREAQEKARREAEAKARREVEEKARKAQALARFNQQEQAAVRARTAADDDAIVAIGEPPAPLRVETKKLFVVATVTAVIVIAGGSGAYLKLIRTPAPVLEEKSAPSRTEAPKAGPPAPAPAPPKAEVPAIDMEKIKRETEERIRREYADKSAAEQAAAAKAAAERAATEKAVAPKTASQKAAAERAATEKSTAERAAAEKSTAERAAAEKAAAERAAAENAVAEKLAAAKAAAEKAATEKAAADKATSATAAAEKAAIERASAEKAAVGRLAAENAAAQKAALARVTPISPARAAPRSAMPSPGDRLVYEAREANRPSRMYEVVVEIRSVATGNVSDVTRMSGSGAMEWRHQPGAYLVAIGSGFVNFSPYLAAFQELRAGTRWSDIDINNQDRCSTDVDCTAEARVAGKEKVSVKSGTYDAWRVVVNLNWRAQGASGNEAYTYWFAEDLKRLVKFQSRGSSFSPYPSMDMELVSIAPAGAHR